MTSLLITDVRVLDPVAGTDAIAHVSIRDGRIDHHDAAPSSASYDETIAGNGLWLMPSAVDLAARFREPGATHKASLASETRAAQAGGIGCVVLPPDTSPVVDTPAMVDRIRGIAARSGGLDIEILGALTQGLKGEALASMNKLGIGQIAMSGREHIVAVGPVEKGLVMEVLRYKDELRPAKTYFSDLPPIKLDEEMVSLARELIARKAAPFAPERFHDSYAEALRALVAEKAKGKRIVAPPSPAAPEGKVVAVPGHGYETVRCAGYAAKLNSVAASDARAFCSALI